MAEFIDVTVKDIDERLTQLRQEVSRLEAARSALVGRGPGRPRGSSRRSAGTRSRRGSGRSRGRRGTRANQALELVRSRPGITIPELAKEMKIAPNYLYRVLPPLAEQGQVRRDGKGWHPA